MKFCLRCIKLQNDTSRSLEKVESKIIEGRVPFEKRRYLGEDGWTNKKHDDAKITKKLRHFQNVYSPPSYKIKM